MPETSKPHVLIVDDEPDDQNPRKRELEAYEIDVSVVHPDDVTSEDLATADLVLVDLILKHWPVRDSMGSISFQPNDGLALTAVLRSHNDTSEAATPTAFAIHTAYLTGASQDLPPEQREHAFARLHNLEWAFSKKNSPDAPSLAQQIVSLAQAVKRLPASWPRDSADDMQQLVYGLLGLSDAESWSAQAWEDIQACHPPIHELYTASHGLAFLRWLLHRILPYPCFLWNTHYLAARLRVTYESLSSALVESRDFTSQLGTFQYNGLLADFLVLLCHFAVWRRIEAHCHKHAP